MTIERGNLVRGWAQDVSLSYADPMLVAKEVFPILPMKSLIAKVRLWNRGDQFRDSAAQRSPGAITPIQDDGYTAVNVDTYQHAHATSVTKEDLMLMGQPTDGSAPPSNDLVTRRIMENARKLDMRLERLTAAAVTGGTWLVEAGTSTAAGVDAEGGWAAATGSNTFLADIDKGCDALVKNGIPRNKIRLLMDRITWDVVKRHADVIGSLNHASSTVKITSINMTQEAVAALLEIDKVVVAQSYYNSAQRKQDKSDFTPAAIWAGTNAAKGFGFLYYFPGPTVGQEDMSAGANCYMPMENGQIRSSYEMWLPENHAWKYESQENIGVQQISAYAGLLWYDTITT